MYRVWTSLSALNSSGYTLLEVLLVFAIMATLFATLPLFGSHMLESNRFRDASSDLYAEVRALQQEARTSGSPRVLTADKFSEHIRRDDNYSLEIDGEIVFFPSGAATSGQLVLRHQNRTSLINVDGVTGTVTRTDQ
jgi:type II secretory pathway pseudopilin PulG